MNDQDFSIYNKFVEHANQYYDGHFTIKKFTTNYRACFGTLHDASPVREQISKMSEGKTLSEAMVKAMNTNNCAYEY